ncbi:MAG: BMP family ABC transporter substrate-binding protein [Clostridia bacterium]|nr:BMP family ABC transporter substrate-binding protein [Clostridia bacterium]
MKKVISVIIAIVLIIGTVSALSGCGKKAAEKYDLVLITDGGTITDKSYNQSAWNGIKDYGDKNKMTYRYYQPLVEEGEELSTDTVKNYIDLAVKGGAKYIVLPGESFSVAAYEIAPTYKDVNFILVDAVPHSQGDKTLRMQQNVMCISFNTLQAGFLAGYSSVIDGHNKLGFIGSINNEVSADYGSGFVQGASFAADELQKPVILDYAEYDNPKLDYDYSFKIKPVYKKRETSKKETFKVQVVNGQGSGVYTEGQNVTVTCSGCPEGKDFDHWEVKSDTEGVSDRKVNISDKNAWEMNLLVGDCDCTIEAVFKDVETVPVNIVNPGADYGVSLSAKDAKKTYYAPKNGEFWAESPAAPSGYVFDHWESSAGDEIFENKEDKGTTIHTGENEITLTPVYVKSDNPTFDVTVEYGTGSGSYVTWDEIKVVADPPQQGYMFYKWENIDNQGLSTGIEMENEYNYTTKFEMVDRFASLAESMYDEGTDVVFGGGNPLSDSIFKATEEFDYPVYVFGHGYDESDKGSCLASVVNDYGAAVQLALDKYKGGSLFAADCSNGCIYVTGKSLDEFQLDEDGNPAKDKDGKEIKNEDYNANYATIFKAISENKLTVKKIQSGKDITSVHQGACLTLNYKVKK